SGPPRQEHSTAACGDGRSWTGVAVMTREGATAVATRAAAMQCVDSAAATSGPRRPWSCRQRLASQVAAARQAAAAQTALRPRTVGPASVAPPKGIFVEKLTLTKTRKYENTKKNILISTFRTFAIS